MSDKISVLTTAIYNLRKIRTILNKVDWVQFRAPTAMGLYVLPYISMRRKPKRWVKYAGNWKMDDPPLSYSIQKWWLENNLQKSKVTINGQWEDQKPHILNFQNPCMDNVEYRKAEVIGSKKNFEGRLTICFSGTLTKNKGVGLILKALTKIISGEMIEEVIFAGDGAERKKYEEISSGIKIRITFRGFLDRESIEDVYERSHIIILPSESEGFPKVIAEAAAYGCVPIVSDVSSISSYFNDRNGFLLKKINSDELAGKIDLALSDREKLKEKSLKCLKVAELFTFENYVKNLEEKILSNG
ncbi:MAG: glycosyltransferase family 4 protein [Ignavibacteria bacterium]|nr:glycosyltransferase family 4 protein [Ignavibacteria bacterium]